MRLDLNLEVLIKRNPNSGFTMVGTLASMAIGAIAMLSMVKMTGDQAKAQRNLAVKGTFDSSLLRLRQYLSYQDNCTANLLPPNFPIATNSTGAPLNVSSIAQIPFVGSPIIASGSTQPGFSSVTLSLEGFTDHPGAADSYTVDLVARAQRKRGTGLANQIFMSKLPLYVQLAPAVNGKRAFISCAVSNNDCGSGKFFQSRAAGCVPPVELRLADPDPKDVFEGEMWLITGP